MHTRRLTSPLFLFVVLAALAVLASYSVLPPTSAQAHHAP